MKNKGHQRSLSLPNYAFKKHVKFSFWGGSKTPTDMNIALEKVEIPQTETSINPTITHKNTS